ncbi:MAG: hypothetical protein N2489_01555, partial [Clostridia bacterium]|nr:hypothetical protein [Clostridia bacterium]
MRLVKRLLALSAAFILLSMQLFPLTANAMREAAPDEKVIAQSGRWQNEMSTNFSTGQTKIYSRYIGNTSQNDKKPPEPFKFSVLTAVRLTKIHIEHNVSKNKIPQGDKDIAISVDLDEKGPGAGVNKFSNIVVSITSKDGTVYGPFYAELNLAGMSQDYAPKTVCATVSFNGSMFLERGSYTLTLENMDTAIYNNETGNAPATVIVGMDKERWESYEKRRNSDILKGIGKEDVKKDENERDDKQQDGQGENKADIKSSDDEIDKIIEIGKELAAKQKKAEEEKEKQTGEKPQFKEALFELTEEAYIDEIQTDHFNGGNGSAPGSIQLFSINDDGSVKKKEGQWNAKGLKVDKTPNAVWSASPDVVLPAGKYKIVDSNTNTLSYDSASLEPIFYVRAIDPPSFNFTGTYFIDIKTAVASSLNKSKIGQGTPFDRQGFELTVIDRGTVMELIGRYTQEKKKDMFFPEKTTGYDFKDVPFSQLCEVTKRDRTKATAEFKLDVNLKNLPYKAQVGTNVIFDFDSEGGIPKVKATGSAFYSRAYKEGYGGDFNTYTVNIKGQRHSEQLPHYVTAQINAMINNIGNIPGPESAAQAAMGAIFPSLAALVVQIGMTMKKPKYIPPEPEGGEGGEGKGPVRDGSDGSDSTDEYENEENESEDSEEQTDEGYGAPLDPSQQIEGFVAGQKSDLENERDEWIRNLEESKKSADPSDPRTQELHKQYEDYINYLNDKIEGLKAPSGDSLGGPRTVTLQFDHTGRTAEIAYDPESGGWYNTESGKPFDMDRYQRDVAPKFQSTRDFLAEQRNKLETGDNAFDRAMKAL